MKKILFLAIVAILASCQNQQSEFIGTWESDNFGGNDHTIVITESGDGYLVLYGTAFATETNGSFETLPYNNGVISTGVLTSDGMDYCQNMDTISVCGFFYKYE